MNTTKNSIRRCFNRAALTYDQFSYPQQIIGNKLIERLSNHVSEIGTIMDLGCGTGIVTAQLASLMRYKRFYAIDMAEKLIELAQTRLQRLNVQLEHGDFEGLSITNQSVNLVFSNMSLQWSEDFFNTLKTINSAMTVNGIFAFSMPIVGTFTEIASASRNSFHAADEIQQQLTACGFTQLDYFVESFTFCFESWIKALKSIKATGANCLVKKTNKTLSRSIAGQATTTTLTYKIGFFIARKTANVS